ncbi:MAG: bifunctional proline dehydrogenase/L-glutamate gamma-semialdehyde dehydrogenase PutA, partial [bacterium]|nr:bifunctional proline dehydrogenase/L-glutamate gamma-semialdehyde dehydrogenase PutA [bacterium]
LSQKGSMIDSLMKRYPLKTQEGVALMCLAEALLRIPDKKTAKKLLKEKMADAPWGDGLVDETSSFPLTKAAICGLKLSSALLNPKQSGILGAIQGLFKRTSEPIIYQATVQMMEKLAEKFVAGITIEDALRRAEKEAPYTHSFDMLGEAALTQKDAEAYFESYAHALEEIKRGYKKPPTSAPLDGPGISVKLSALHPRYEFIKKERVLKELFPKILKLSKQAKEINTHLTIDAEEADRLVVSLELFKQLAEHKDLKGWNGLGLVVQAYQKRAPFVIDWLAALAQTTGHQIPIRLVKGAYWDSEIKHAQELGVKDYPVFTRKANTDVSYLACAKKMIQHGDLFFPQFATHNVQTIATLLEWLPSVPPEGAALKFEFQMLHGMGHVIYDSLVVDQKLPCRIYAPVGAHHDLLPYLVRRLLENGANSSFVNHIGDTDPETLKKLVDFPDENAQKFKEKRHPKIPFPEDLYGKTRKNSQGLNLKDMQDLRALTQGISRFKKEKWSGCPLTTAPSSKNFAQHDVYAPAEPDRKIGSVTLADKDLALSALEEAQEFFPTWRGTSVEMRAQTLHKVADLFEENRDELISLLVFESGKTLEDGVLGLREAVNFCRYYAVQAEKLCATPLSLPGPTGEENTLSLQGRGTFLCISPWNFPLAIFTGQVVAALAAGNTVLAKPATPSTLIATKAIQLMHLAGIPVKALHLLPGGGRDVGDTLTSDPRVAGVAFTGSTKTAWHINRQLASRQAPIAPFIAETGGQNAMVIDSTALMEQAVSDVIRSAFQSAGQRCSALRVVFVQKDILPHFKEMLCGTMAELSIGLPQSSTTDIGPIIDEAAQKSLQGYIGFLKKSADVWCQTPVPDDLSKGHFVPPTVAEITFETLPKEEHFGPILHVVPYDFREIKRVIKVLNGLGFGLTFGLHSRLQGFAQELSEQINAGNIYVNRNMIGAVVGSQPFGGMGLSGTGPKAGGPHYLLQFMCEKTVSIDTTAQGGNASLLTLA